MKYPLNAFPPEFNKSVTAFYPNSKMVEVEMFQEKPGDILNSFTIEKQIGKGMYAVIYVISDDRTGKRYAARAVPADGNLRLSPSQVVLAHYDMAPKLYYHVLLSLKGRYFEVTIMDLITGTLIDILKGISKGQSHIDIRGISNALTCLLDKKYLLNCLHGDMHIGNIVLLGDGKTLGFIDFDFTIFNVTGASNILDAFPLIGSLVQWIKKNPGFAPLRQILARALQYYKKRFHIVIDPSNIRPLPNGSGYCYNPHIAGKPNILLHPYFMIGRVTADEVIESFPSIKLPKVTN